MKPYNLLDEPWLPVRCASGAVRWIRPCDITATDAPAVRVESGRADFDSALTQFLIGLVQTTCTPEHEQAWRVWATAPPSPAELQKRFAPVHDAFFLTGHTYLFMQDVEMPAGQEPWAIAELLIDGPGANAVAFAKPDAVPALGLPFAAAALLCLQLNAPSGGRGHRTSLRGGGPLTTLVHQSDRLWPSVWGNVLNRGHLALVPGNASLQGAQAIFPWMGPTITSVGNKELLPSQASPFAHHWSMPRRIRLSEPAAGMCALSGIQQDVVGTYCTKDLGVNYAGAWQHPLTPYRVSEEDGDAPISWKGRSAKLSYRDWLEVALGGAKSRPAAVVSAFRREVRHKTLPGTALWCSGYQMDNMKPVGFSQTTTPLLHIDEEGAAVLRANLALLVAASDSVRDTVRRQVTEALTPRGGELRGDLSFLNETFLVETQPDFFAAVEELQTAVVAGTEAEVFPGVAERWLTTLQHAAKRIFSQHSQERGAVEALDIKRVAQAWNTLNRFVHPHNNKLRQAAGLPPHVRESTTPAPTTPTQGNAP